MFTVLGIDPGSQYTGVAAIRWDGAEWQHLSHQVLDLGRGRSLPERLSHLQLGLRRCLAHERPQLVVVERVFLGKNVESAFTLGHARGVALSVVGEFEAELMECAPKSVKKGVTGHGGASKDQVEMFLRAHFRLAEFERQDASDALALALYGGRTWLAERKIDFQKLKGRETQL